MPTIAGAYAHEARSLIEAAVIWENHACMPLRPEVDFLPQLSRLRRSGYTVVSLNVGMDLTDTNTNVRLLAVFRAWVREHPDEYMLVGSAADVLEAKRQGRLGVCFDLEGLGSLDGQLSLIDLYYELGVRWALLTYNKTNPLAGGCQDDDTGLSPLGRSVLARMESVGMVPCCSHAGWRTAREILELATGPVIFSHSNAHAVFAHPRNIPDELIKACADTGGVIGVNGISRFIGRTDAGFDNSTEGLFRHLDHMVQLVGPRHVGLGLDYVFDTEELLAFYRARPDLFPPENGYSKPTPMVEPERLPDLVATMLAHGYDAQAIRGILGENHLRVAAARWR
ncbi:MAG TPA: membrane dipeptidase [Steroidobacteraceae bacterium]|nr:membrane dipeptidase [Steroidobacteraceae bacterium]